MREDICYSSHICFLNCCHCPIAEKATKEEKREALKELKKYRKKLNLNNP